MKLNAPTRFGRIPDARGRVEPVLDPVAMRLLHRHDEIESRELARLSEEISPHAGGRMGVAIAYGVGLALVLAVGQFLYHRVKGSWSGVDAVSLVIWGLQLIMCFVLAGFVWTGMRRAGRERALGVLLRHRRCAHCGYNLGACEADASDGATVCPECGSAWDLAGAGAEGLSPPPPVRDSMGKLLVVAVLGILAMITLVVFVIRTLAM